MSDSSENEMLVLYVVLLRLLVNLTEFLDSSSVPAASSLNEGITVLSQKSKTQCE